MAVGDLTMVAGTTLRFQLTWEAENEQGKLEPVKMHGCTAKFAMRDIKRNEVIATADTNDGIEIDPESGVITVSIAADKTLLVGPASNGAVDYEVRVYFPSGDVYPLVHACIEITRGAIDA